MASIDPPSGLDEEVFFGPVTQRELIITWRKRRQERMKKERDEALKEKECALSREEPDVKKPHIQLEERQSDLTITDDEQLSDIYSDSNGKAGQASDHQPQGTETSCTTIDMECAGNNIFEIGLNSENETKETSSVQEASINEHLSDIQNDEGSVIDSSKPEDISACSTSNNYVEAAEDHQLDTKTIGTPRKGANCVVMPFIEEAMSPNTGSLEEKCPNLGVPAHHYLQFQSNDEVCSSFEEESVVEDDSFHIDRNSCVGNVSKEVPLSEEVSFNTNTSEVQEELYLNCKLEVSECLLRELDETPANEKSEEYEDAMEDSYQHDTESVHPPSKEDSYSSNDSPIKTCPELHERELQRDALQALIETVSHQSGIVPNEEKESPIDVNLKLCGISVEVAESVHQNAVTDQEQSIEASSIDGISILNSDIEQNESVSGLASIELDHHKSEGITTEEPISSFTGSLEKSEVGRPGFDNDRPSHNSYRVITSLEGECGAEDHASHVEQVCVENASKDTLLTDCEPGESQSLLREVEETLACDKSENYEDAVEEYRQSSDVSIQSPTKEADYSTKDVSINKKSVEFEKNESELVAEQVLVLPGVNSSVVQNGEDESSNHVKSESYYVLVEGSDNGRPSHNCDRYCTSLEEECDAEDHASHIEQVGVENASKEVPFVERVSLTANMSEIQQELISRPIVLLTNYETGESQYLLREAEETLANDKSENFEDAVEEHRQPNDLSLQSPTNIADYSSKDVSINNTSKSVEFEDSELELVAEQVIVVPGGHLSGVVQNGEDEPSTHVKSESYDMVEEYCQSNDVSMQSPTNKADYSSKDVSVSKNSVEYLKNESELVAEQVLVVPGSHLSGVVQNGEDESSNHVESESYDMVEEYCRSNDVSMQSPTNKADYSSKDVSVSKNSVEYLKNEPELVAEQVRVVPGGHLSGVVQNGEDESSNHVESESYDMVEEYCQSNDVSMQSPTNKADYSSKDVSVSKNSVEYLKNESELVAEQVLVVPGGHLSGVAQNGEDESSNHVESESYDMVEDVVHPSAVVLEKTSAEDISVQDLPCASQDPEVRELSKGQTSFDFAYENGTRQMQRNQNLNNSCAQQQVSTKDDVPINRDPEENKENGPALILISPTIMPEVRPDKMIGTPLAWMSTSGCSKSDLTAPKSNIPKPSILKPATLNVDPSSLNTTWVKRLNMSKIPKPKRPCYVQPLDTL